MIRFILVVSDLGLEVALRSAIELIPNVVCETVTLNRLVRMADPVSTSSGSLRADVFLVVDSTTEKLSLVKRVASELKSRIVRVTVPGERIGRLNPAWFKLDPNAPLIEVVRSLRMWMDSSSQTGGRPHFYRASVGNLQVREIQILELLAGGKRYVDIAEVLGISVDTVRSHLRRIYPKLGVQCRTAAVSAYIRQRGSFRKHPDG